MEPLTPSQRRILDALSDFIEEKGYAPSLRELAHKVGLKSPNTADYHLKALEEKGYVKCPKNRLRAIELVRETLPYPNSVRIPVLGSVPAGGPNLAVEEHDHFIDVDRSLLRSVSPLPLQERVGVRGTGKTFALKVKGDSMKDAGILDGDMVVVKVQSTAEDGEIVVARFEDETTVKFLKKKRDGIYLVPANEKYKPIPAGEAELIGKVTAVIRRY